MQCPKCGRDLDPRDRFCSRCGEKSQQDAFSISNTAIVVDDPNLSPADYSTIKLHVLLLRALAFILDFGAYVSIMLALVLFVIGSAAVTSFEDDLAQAYFVIFGLFILYNAVLESTGIRGSIGKLLLGIKVTSMRGMTMKFLFSVARNFIKLLPILVFSFEPLGSYGKIAGLLLFMVFFLYPFFTKQGMTVPDLICGCRIVSRRERRKKAAPATSP